MQKVMKKTGETTHYKHLVHLSYAGFHVGKRLCGIPQVEGPRSIYALSVNPRNLDLDVFCPACREVWETEQEEED